MPELTDRYVHAVVRAVPTGQRSDVAAELHASIDDAVEDLTASGLPAQEAEERVLTGLGDPAALAERYGGAPRYLIGPAFYGDFVRLVRVLLVIVVPIIGITTLWSSTQSGVPAWDAFLDTVGSMVYGGIQLTFWVILVFAVLERLHVSPQPGRGWSLAELPHLPERRIGRADVVWSIAILAWLLFAVLRQREHWLVAGEPVLNPDLWSFWLPMLVVVLIASIGLEIAKYRSGSWTVPLATVNTVLNLAFASIVIGLWSDPGLVNPVVLAGLPAGAVTLLDLIPWGVGIVCLLDTAEGWYRALRR